MTRATRACGTRKNRLLIVENQLKFVPAVVCGLKTVSHCPSVDGGPKTLEGLKQQLMEYQTKYTDNHPDVLVLKRRIEAGSRRKLAEGAVPRAARGQACRRARRAAASMEGELLGQQQAILRNIQAIEAEIVKIQAPDRALPEAVENTPKREQDCCCSKRDYDNIKATYSSC